MTAWYKDWFNSPYYHILYKDRDQCEAAGIIENLKDALKIPPDAKILDLGCGRGRHALYLNNSGFDVTGLDLSEENIRFASKHENDKLHFFKHDMRKPFRSNYFDYVFNLFSSFGYFKTDKEHADTIKHAATALKKGGILVIDFFNVHKVKKEFVPEEVKNISGIEFHIKRSIRDKYIVKEIDFSEKGEIFQYSETVRLLTEEDFIIYFDQAGLKLKALKGNYNLEDFNSAKSPRLILFAEKV